MDFPELEKLAFGAAVLIVAWLGWPVAVRIRSAAMIDVSGEIAALRGNCEKLLDHYRKLDTRVTLLEKKDSNA